MNQGTQDAVLSISAAGTVQGTATLLIAGLNQVTTVASGAGVVLFPANEGCLQVVFNGGANALKVYPPLGGAINQLAVNSAHILPTNTTCQYWFFSSTLIIANQSA